MKLHVPGLGVIDTVDDPQVFRVARVELRTVAKQERKVAAKKCRTELAEIRKENVADLQAAEGRAVRRVAAGERRCRIRDSGIRRRVKESDAELAAAQRKAARARRRREEAEGTRAMRVRRAASNPARHERTRKRLTGPEIEERITEARSALGQMDDRGSAAAALWWFDRKTLRSMLGRLRPGANLFEVAVEAYESDRENIDAAYFERTEGKGAKDAQKRDRAMTRDYKKRQAATRPILMGAPMRADVAARVRRALEAWGHKPKLARPSKGVQPVRCELCEGRGRIVTTTRGESTLRADARLRAMCTGEAPAPF